MCAFWNEAAALSRKRGKQPSTVGIFIAAVKFVEGSFPSR